MEMLRQRGGDLNAAELRDNAKFASAPCHTPTQAEFDAAVNLEPLVAEASSPGLSSIGPTLFRA